MKVGFAVISFFKLAYWIDLLLCMFLISKLFLQLAQNKYKLN
jgi:hypothetical protein